MSDVIDSFEGKYRFLSNFWPITGGLHYDGILYPTTEHAYQALKTMDDEKRMDIALLGTAGQAKRAGKTIKPLRWNWETIKLDIMFDLNFLKFARNRTLREKLLATGDAELIEGNTWGDTFWGQCNGKGQNELGNIIMQVRELLQ